MTNFATMLFDGDGVKKDEKEAFAWFLRAAKLGEASAILAEIGDVPCSIWSGMRQVHQLLDQERVDEAGAALVAAAGRLASFDRPVDSDLVALACRWALATGDVSGAARLLGHADANGLGDDEGLATCRTEIGDRLTAADVDRLTAEGAAADLRRVLGWIGAAGA